MTTDPRAGTNLRRPAPTRHVGPVDDGDPVGPVLVTVAGDGPQPPHHDREAGAERVPEPRADNKTGEAMAEPVPINLPESWAVGAGLGSAGLLGGAGGRDPITHPEPADPEPRDVQAAVR